jgi:hypothetical protein
MKEESQMLRFSLATLILAVAIGSSASTQPAPVDERGTGITVMRAINTAENAVRQSGGKYVELPALVDHRYMAKVRPSIVVNGNTIMYQGHQLRVALSADALQYQAMVVPAATCGTAVFSDERGLIYTGKVLDC